MSEVVERVVVDTGPVDVKFYESENMIELRKTVYPIYPYSNRVTVYITISKPKDEKGKFTLNASQTRLDWNGTGHDDWGTVELTPEEAAEIMSEMRNVKSEEDFDRLTEKFRELREKIEKEVEEKFSELVDEVMDFLLKGEMRDVLRDEDARKRLREYLIDAAHEYFADC